MESAERPTKIRKLSHDEAVGTAVNLLLSEDAIKPVTESNVPLQAQGKQGKITKLAANSTAVTDEQNAQFRPGPDYSENHNEAPQPTQPLSKNQLKKQRKKQEWEAGRAWRKARDKERDAEKKAKKREQKQKEEEERKAQGLDSKPQAKPERPRPTRLPVTFLIDCGFDDKMSEKERISLGSQVTRAYSDNYRAAFQAHLMVSSWGGLLKERFDTVLHGHHVNWRGFEFTEKDFVAAANIAKASMTGSKGGNLAGFFEKYKTTSAHHPKSETANGSDDHSQPTKKALDPQGVAVQEPGINTRLQEMVTDSKAISTKPQSEATDIEILQEQGEVIYLTSDSPHTLSELKPYSTYIIGGLVDKNRHKGICYKVACEKGVKTAKLPIGQFMEMNSRFVLATNHVVEIMIYWLECGDWAEAFMKAIPKRKGGKLREERPNSDVYAKHTNQGDGPIDGGSDVDEPEDGVIPPDKSRQRPEEDGEGEPLEVELVAK